MGDKAIFHFAGSDLSTGLKIRKAAVRVVESGYTEVVVVVSTVSETTDDLIDLMSELSVSEQDYAEILSMWERTSVRIFSSALRALGAKATYFDPIQENWPIITTSDFRNAEPDLAETKMRVNQYLVPILGESIPVICGLLGRDKHGHITLLSEGGSKDTALLLVNCLKADEVKPQPIRQ